MRAHDLLQRLAAALEGSRTGRFVLDIARATVALAQGFRGERISLRAAALTYISIFSMVPTLAVALALMEIFGLHALHTHLNAFVYDVLAPGIREETQAVLSRFIHSARSVGGVGFVVLAISAGSLLKNLDTSINEIWNVRRKRPWPLRITLYAAILLLGPVLLTLSLAGMGVLQDAVRRLVPFSGEVLTVAGGVVAVLGFTFAYQVTPNAEVRFRSALAGGLVAGLGWDVAKHVYGGLAAQLFRASPVWGSLSAIPLFLTWIYVSWLLLLFGARLSYAVQFAWFRRGDPDLATYPRGHALLAARVAAALARAEARHGPAVSVATLAEELGATRDVLDPVIERLVRAGLLRLLPGGLVAPARPLDELTLADNALAVGAADPANPALIGENPGQNPPADGLGGALWRAEEAFLSSLRQIRWRDLPALDGPGPVEAPAPPVHSVQQKP